MKLEAHRFIHALVRQGGEILIIVVLALLVRFLSTWGILGANAACWIVVALAAAKAVWFVMENLYQLLQAVASNMPYHKFMVLMMVNTAQVMMSFALDYWVLQTANPESLGGIDPAFTQAELMFECLYYSVLDFSFFGYGDITPQTIPAKLVTMMEVVLAFFTMIFLLSDFVSLKESLAKSK
ncbi:MAG: two pore domain potassium channel family protein [Verrucomicrobiaceae bacterium]|nr:two pore domain potassium channel family protein [Verrucomicrobiaceae bacterium]